MATSTVQPAAISSAVVAQDDTKDEHLKVFGNSSAAESGKSAVATTKRVEKDEEGTNSASGKRAEVASKASATPSSAPTGPIEQDTNDAQTRRGTMAGLTLLTAIGATGPLFLTIF